MVFERLLGKRRHEAAESETASSLEEPSTKIQKSNEWNIVVAVHGLGGDWEKTWSHQVTGKMWLRDFLPQKFPNIRVMSFGYDSAHALSRSVADINSAATLLVDRLSGERVESLEKKRPIVFVAHSLGGIVVKKAIILANERSEYWKDISESSLGAAFFAVPHRGADVAYWGDFAVDIFNFATLGTLGNTNFLQSLKRNSGEFSNISQAFIQPASKFPMIRTFTESVKIGNMIIVDKDSATLGIQNEMSVEIPGADHQSICRFAAANLQSYRLVENALRQIFSKIEIATIGFTEKEIEERVADFTTNALECLKFKEIFHRREHIIDAHSKTCQWIFVEPEQAKPFLRDKNNFVSWLKEGPGIYWISGKAGSGKSTLMKYLCDDSRIKDYLKSWSGDLKLVTVECYFWAAGTEYQRSFAGLLRSLLYGALKKLPKLIPVVFDDQLKTYMNSPNLVDQKLAEKIISVDEKSLTQYFKKLTQQRSVSTRLCFFIDGLDEFGGKAGDLIKFFQFLTNTKDDIYERIKICVSSRPELEYQKAFTNSPSLRMQDLNQEDILLYVRDHLTSHDVINDLMESESSEMDSLIRGIVTRAEGVFLWVRLVVGDLTTGINYGDRIDELWHWLNDLPVELNDLYSKMLDRVKQKNQSYYEDGLRYFNLVQACHVPPSILTINFADTDVTRYLGISSATLTINEMKEQCRKMTLRLSSRCAGLLEVPLLKLIEDKQTTSDKSIDIFLLLCDSEVKFIHRTARDYARKLTPNNPIHKDFNAHENLARSYLVQLKHYHTGEISHVIRGRKWFTNMRNFDWWATAESCSRHLRELDSSKNEAHIAIMDTIFKEVSKFWEKNRNPWLYRPRHSDRILGPPMVMAIVYGFDQYVVAKITKINLAEYEHPGLPLLPIAVSIYITGFCHRGFSKELDGHKSFDASISNIVKHLLDCKADPERTFSITTAAKYLIFPGFDRNYPYMGSEVSPWGLYLQFLHHHCAEEKATWVRLMDILKLFLHYGVNMSYKISEWNDMKLDCWEILSKFYEHRLPEKVQELKKLMLEKGYCPEKEEKKEVYEEEV